MGGAGEGGFFFREEKSAPSKGRIDVTGPRVSTLTGQRPKAETAEPFQHGVSSSGAKCVQSREG